MGKLADFQVRILNRRQGGVMEFFEVIFKIVSKRGTSIILIALLVLSLSIKREDIFTALISLIVSVALAFVFGSPAEEWIESSDESEKRLLGKLNLRLIESVRLKSDLPPPEVRATVVAAFSSLFKEAFSESNGYKSYAGTWGDTMVGTSRLKSGILGNKVAVRMDWYRYGTVERVANIKAIVPPIIYGVQPEKIINKDPKGSSLSIVLDRTNPLWLLLTASATLFLIVWNIQVGPDEEIDFWKCAVASALTPVVLVAVLKRLTSVANKSFPEYKLRELLKRGRAIFEDQVVMAP
jgi:hypothetical protein